MSQSLSGAESKALTLLGNGHPNHIVAQATGLSDSRVSQLLSEDWFSSQVTELRYKALLKHNDLDEKYDAIEESLVTKLQSTSTLLFNPLQITRVLSQINAMKRRGVSSPDSIATQQPALSLIMPTVVIQQFVKSGNNQVVEVDNTPLVTIQPGQLQRLHENGIQSRITIPAPENGTEKQGNSAAATLRKRLADLRERQNARIIDSVANPA